ncbi:MAG: type IV pilus twitching motility protein PilT [Deinococcales bacterium]
MSQPSTELNIVNILKHAVERDASDVILTTSLPPQYKVHGEWSSGEFTNPLTHQETRRLMYMMMTEKQQRIFEERRDIDFSYTAQGIGGRFRVNAFFQRTSVGGVMRLIPTKTKPIEEIGIPVDVLVQIASQPRGLVLVTGPTGSGKSTTLASMIDWINTNKKKHIVTIEDPVEFAHSHKSSIINQREIGSDTQNFEMALRAVLRQAPDVILVGEMRDYETIRSAVTAAETGHLVLGTLHTNSAPEAIDRIVDVFPEEQQEQIRVQLANNLNAIITQQMLPKISGDGRVVGYEIMIATPAVRALIREGKTYQLVSVIQTGASLGMITMDACLAELYKKRLITFELGESRAVDAKEFNRLAKLGEVPAGQQRPSGQAVAPAPAPANGFGRR